MHAFITLLLILANISIAKSNVGIEVMALGDSAWIEGKGEFEDKHSYQIHPGLENIHDLKSQDVNIINLEATPTYDCTKFVNKPFTFAVGKNTILGFASWGFNMFALANNHSADCSNPPVNHTVDKAFELTKTYLPTTTYHGVAKNEFDLLKPAVIKVKRA